MGEKITLLKILWIKEKKFWQRNKEMYKKLGLIGFIFAIPFMLISYYSFKLMHTLFEIYLWVFKRKRFKRNLIKMYDKL